MRSEVRVLPESRLYRVLFGVCLIALGVVLMLGQLHVLPGGFWLYGWAYFVIAFGVARLATARTAHAVGNGVMLTLLGAWFLLVRTGWHGLTLHNSWPLAVVAVGAAMVARAIAGAFLPDFRWRIARHHEESRHDV